MRALLRHLGAKFRGRKRADCLLCRGGSVGTVAFTEKLWKCHRCGEGGDVYTLVRALHGCDFRGALCFVADLAGVSVDQYGGSELRRHITEQRKRRERLDRAARELESKERALRLSIRQSIQTIERGLRERYARLAHISFRSASARSREADRLQKVIELAHWVLRYDLLPSYTLLAFGAIEARAAYVLATSEQRIEIAKAVAAKGFLIGEEGRRVEVLS